MLLAIATPLIDKLLKNWALATIPILVVFWLLDIGETSTPSIEATLFFTVGALASTRGWSVFSVDRLGKPLLMAYPALLLIDSLNIAGKFDSALHHITVAVGICATLHLTSFIHAGGRIASALLKLAGSSFFVYAAHEPLLTIARKLSLSLLRNAHESALVLLYISLPILLAGLLVLLYRTLSALMPSALSFVSGGRK
jgi:peptidoglycan/LPS O-acetylase OafA/YrhL